MRFGIAIPHSGPLASPEAIRKTARKAEKLGLDSIWVHDHISYGRDWLGHRLSGLAAQITSETYPYFYESMNTLSFIAGFTKKIQLATNIVVLPLRNPLVLGRQIATIQGLSKGRLIFGTGNGDYPAEFRVMNVPYGKRAIIMEEYLEIIKRVLNGGSVSYHGRFLDFDDAHFYPKVKPPPILIGGGVISVPEPAEDQLAMSVLKRVARLGDGWAPDWGSPQIIRKGVKMIRKFARECRRGDVDFEVAFTTALNLTNNNEDTRRITAESLRFSQQEANLVARYGIRTLKKTLRKSLIGSAKSVRKKIQSYSEAGVTHFNLIPLTPDIDSLLGLMEVFTKEVAT